MKKKIVSVLLAATMALGLTACGGNGGSAIQDPAYKDRSTSIKFSYYAGGYGSTWLEAVTKDYMDNVNKDVYIELVPSYDNSTAYSDVKSGSATADLYQIEVGVFDATESLADLSDVYEANAYGEETKIKDKLTADIVEFYNQDGKYYQMPNTTMTGWNWVYNKTVLDAVFGEGNYTLPRTTDEMFEFGQQLFAKDTYLTVGAFADTQGGDYLKYAFGTWFAQMTGAEGYDNFNNGLYEDGGKLVLSKESPKVIEANKTAIEEAYKVAYELCNKQKHYVFGDSASLNYKSADQVFYGGGYGMNRTKVAALYTGAWIETEVADLLADGIIENQELVAGKMPVISAITSRCKTVKDEKTLLAVIDYVDGTSTDKPSGVSDDDIAIIKEARNMTSENICRTMVVPKSGKNIDTVKDFLAYLASDRAQKLSAQNANGLNMLPFGYVPTEEDMGFEMSGYIKSINAKRGDDIIIDFSNLAYDFASATNLSWCYDMNTGSGTLATTMFAGKATEPKDIYNSTYDYYNTDKWAIATKNLK